MRSPVHNVKRKQKESLLLREISKLYLEVSLDHPSLQALFINRVELSSDKGICYVYFYSPKGLEFFKEQLQFLKLFKPSLRRALSKNIHSRRTPEIIFKFDDELEKQEEIDRLIDDLNTGDDSE